MNAVDYWEECLSDALCEVGIDVSPEQLKTIAKAVENAHENYGLAFYNPGSSHIVRELAETKRKLVHERNKVVCPECRGAGTRITNGPCYFAESQCSRCHGEGKVAT